MEIEVRLFAAFRDYLPSDSASFSFKRSLPREMEVCKIAEELKLPDNIPKIFVVNGNVVTGAHMTRDGDVVSIFPPVAGG